MFEISGFPPRVKARETKGDSRRESGRERKEAATDGGHRKSAIARAAPQLASLHPFRFQLQLRTLLAARAAVSDRVDVL
jgi:hypothetical protein